MQNLKSHKEGNLDALGRMASIGERTAAGWNTFSQGLLIFSCAAFAPMNRARIAEAKSR